MPTSQPKAEGAAEKRPSLRPGGAASLLGTTLGGRYRIDKLLGEGGMGAVYQAEHTHMRKRLAVKVLHPEMSRLPEVVARFEREAMAAAHIDHPNVATATDFGKLEDGSFFLVLEFVEGKSLREALAQGRLELGRALRILRQIAAALQRAHALGIVHRDLKPENVMLIERDGEPDFVKVLDFGIAKVPVGELSSSGAPEKPATALTQLGMVYGTPEYMAPEQALGQNVDPRADIYALGVMTFEMLAGVRPFDHESKVTLLGMHVTAPVPAITAKCADAYVPPEVEAIVQRMLAKEATHRYADSKELIEVIDSIWTAAYGTLPVAGSAPQSQANPRGSLVSLAGTGAAGSSPSSLAGGRGSMGSLPGNPSVSGTLTALPQDGLSGALGRVSSLVRGNPRPFLFGGIGAAVLLGIVLVVALVSSGGKATTSADGGLVVAVGSATAPKAPDDIETQVNAAVALIEKGDYATGIEKLTELESKHGGRADIHRALLRAYLGAKRSKEGIHQAELWLAIDPSAAKDAKLHEDVRNAAIGALGKDVIDPGFALLEGKMGSVGPDILYDIAYGASGTGYPQAAARAQRSLMKPDVRAQSSPALAVTMDIRSARDCEGKKRHFEKAREVGDKRTALMLRGYASTKGCGFLSSRDCWPCMHRDGSLARTIAAADERQ